MLQCLWHYCYFYELVLVNVLLKLLVLKKFTLIAVCLITLAISFFSNSAKASHAAGGELIYEHVSDSTYRFIFKFYRDCSGIGQPPSVSMCYTNTCTNQTASRVLRPVTTLPNGSPNGTQVSTGCANQPSTCVNTTSSIPGYREWWYTDTLTLPFRCNYWKFAISIGNRNTSENLVGQQLFYVEATLNNSLAQGNSSPVFSVKPVPYVCINQPYKYNNGGVDPNGDSVAFEVIQPLAGGNCSGTIPKANLNTSASPAITFPNNPFQTNNTFSISATNGELSFTPGLQGAQTVSVRANEYRNGNLIGSVMRDIQVQVLPCTGGGGSVTPTLTIDPSTVSGAATLTGGTIYGCATQQFSFCYDMKSTDPNAVLVVSDNSGAALPGATVSYTNLQTDSARGCVTWTPNPTDTGTRVFVVTVKDSACSTSGIAISHSITVPVYVYAVTAALKDTAICAGDSTVLIGVGGTAYVWTAVPGGSGVSSLSCTSCKNPVAKPTVTTSYIVSSNSISSCNKNSDTVTVTVIQQFANATSNTPVCPGSDLELYGNSAPGLTYIWTGPNGFTSNQQNPVIPNAQSVNSGVYKVQVTNGTCSSSVYSINVYVGPPAGPAASSNSPVCVNEQIILTATNVSGTNVVYNWTGPNGFTSNQQNPMINNATLANAGKYYVNATIDGCPSFSDSVEITVDPLPAPPVTNPDTFTYCEDGTATALTATGTNLKWYTSKTGGTGTANFVPPTTTAGTFKYYVSQTNSNGCESERDSVTVIILTKPAVPTATTPIIYCQNDAASPLTANGTNLQWYVTPTGGTSIGAAPVPSTTTPGNTVYFVSQTSNTTGCESDRFGVTVTVTATPPPPTVNSPGNYCEDQINAPDLTFYAFGQNLTWYSDPTGGTGSATPPPVNVNVPSRDTTYVTQTINNCESQRAMLIYEVIAKPVPPTPNNVTYCQFETPVAVSATGQTLLWYTSATGGVGNATAPVPVTTSPGVFKFYVSQTNSNGCESERDSVEVTVYAKPPQPVGNDDSICEASTATALTATGQNLLWYTNPVGGVGSTAAPVPSTTTPGTYFWYVSQSINGCESDRDTVEIEVVPKPQPPVADTAELCLNGPTMQMTATGQDLLWYSIPTGGIGSPVAPSPSTSTIDVITYYVSQTVDGCESDRDTSVAIVDTLVTVRLSIKDPAFCLYDTIEISQQGQMPDTANFTWTWDGATVISGDTSGPYMVKWNTPGIKTITVFADDNGCKASDTTTVEALPIPNARFELGDEVCAGQELDVVVTEDLFEASQFTWSFDTLLTGIINVDSNKFTVMWDTAGVQVISLQTISDSGCVSDIYYDTITVRDYPKPQILPVENSTLCLRTEIPIQVKPLTGGQYRYKWEPEEYFLENLNSSVTARIPSSGFISVTATDQYGCSGSDSTHLKVKLCCTADLPNAFSPNGDGRNDDFGIMSNGRYEISAFRVVNRYGQIVFSTTNQNDRWDGTKDGEPQGIGTYYYYIKYSCLDDDANNEVETTGDIILIR